VANSSPHMNLHRVLRSVSEGQTSKVIVVNQSVCG
jgi:hypothetical protein